ncbi:MULTISPECIES: DUF3859 domain-containing protein [unclassified Agarivorans]|uniref:DUF3859 domain-containing protein n=1 Tax=unclassified Agarivorans TaxID=2636026 RepID=UPI0026E352D8|nr:MULTISPECIES: DUF3859 domain-containing protein [unclassified Agarivorans]MDO6687599.1 DUF3859 domain-containing protein [Agarivorans sp. 3_MG-2023]MDO6717068.1 DUF3859 domain-containing protein [Agarivorans sp. 2_MG-2023]
MKTLYAAALILLAGCASTESNTEVTSTILDYGIYGQSALTGEYSNNDTPNDSVLTGKSGKVTEQTAEISAQVGTTFGYCFEVEVDQRKIELTKAITSPEMIDEDGNSYTSMSYTKTLKLKKGKASNCHFYMIEEEWEAVKGEWYFSVFHGEELLSEKKFNLH